MPSSNSKDRRTEILDATLEVIRRDGVMAMRMADVADQAGVSLGLVQHYFRHRQKLVADAFDRLLANSLPTWETIRAAETTTTRRLFLLLNVCVAGRMEFHKLWTLWFEFFTAARWDDDLRQPSQKLYAEWRETFRVAITEGTEDGSFQSALSPDDFAVQTLSLIDGLGLRVLLGQLEVDEERMLEILIRTSSELLSISPEDRDAACVDLPERAAALLK
jgi:AcrR family transcriptional regulator